MNHDAVVLKADLRLLCICIAERRRIAAEVITPIGAPLKSWVLSVRSSAWAETLISMAPALTGKTKLASTTAGREGQQSVFIVQA
jgi:hypothetical protein